MLKNFNSIPNDSTAIIIGSSGGIGRKIYDIIKSEYFFGKVYGLSRKSKINIDYFYEDSIRDAAKYFYKNYSNVRLIINCTGYLYDESSKPEKSYKEIDLEYLKKSFYINTFGPALIMKYFTPIFPKEGQIIFANFSAKVGSISDNKLGGWYSYRSSKASLNQFVKCLSIELKRKNKESICVSIHPGTVSTELSKPFNKNGLDVRSPNIAAEQIINVLNNLDIDSNGKFIDYLNNEISF